MADFAEHLAQIRRNWTDTSVRFDSMCVNLVRGHMKELETITDALAERDAEIARLREALLAVKPFVQAVAENAADEPIADNGMTVWDGLQNQAPSLIGKINAALEKTDV